jgi:hypothetical protein
MSLTVEGLKSNGIPVPAPAWERVFPVGCWVEILDVTAQI